MRASHRVEREEVIEHAPPTISLPKLQWLERPLPDDDVKARAAHFLECRTIRAGRDALAAIERAESFDSWMAIGRALAVGKAHALRTTGANRAWGRTYSRVFGDWMKVHGFGTIPKSTRSVAIELAENSGAITSWREGLPEKQRRRLIHPLSITRRWRAATASADARSPADLRRDARAAWKRFCVCADALPPDQAAPLWLIVKGRCALERSP